MTSGSNCGVHAASAITETDLDGRFWLGHAKQKEGKELECPGLSQEAENRDSGSLVHGRAEILQYELIKGKRRHRHAN